MVKVSLLFSVKNYFFMKNILLFTALSFLASLCFANSGIDWRWAKMSEHFIITQYLGVTSVFIGMIAPIVFPLYFYIKRKQNDSNELLARVAVKAFLVAWAYSTLIKSFTNRLPREPFESLGAVDFSKKFRFGFLQGENLWESLVEGFPSGHTMTAFAMTFAILPFLSSQKTKRIAVFYSVYIGLGVSVTVHWLSDTVAGGFIGFALGNFISSKQK